MEEQLSHLKLKRKLVAEANALVQREVYLAEEIETLQQGSGLVLPPATQSTIDQYNKVLNDLSTKLHENWRSHKRLTFESPGGAWIREDERRASAKKQRLGSLACQGRGGCCAFGCGCCEKVRAFRDVPKERPTMYLYSHCTIECACCHRRELRAFGTQKK